MAFQEETLRWIKKERQTRDLEVRVRTSVKVQIFLLKFIKCIYLTELVVYIIHCITNLIIIIIIIIIIVIKYRLVPRSVATWFKSLSIQHCDWFEFLLNCNDHSIYKRCVIGVLTCQPYADWMIIFLMLCERLLSRHRVDAPRNYLTDTDKDTRMNTRKTVPVILWLSYYNVFCYNEGKNNNTTRI